MNKFELPPINSTFINLKYDWGFKYMFGSKERSNILKQLLNAVFEGEFVIKEITFEDKEILPPKKDGKGLFFDVHCVTDNNFHFIVEMQQRDVDSFGKRMVFYTLAAVYKQGTRGNGYDFEPVYSVIVTKFKMDQFDPGLVNEVVFKERVSNRIFTEDVRMIFLSLAQVHDDWDDCKSEIERMLYLIKNMEKLNKDSKPYKSGEYQDIFDAAEVSQMACEDVVAYYKDMLRQDEMEEAVATAERKGIKAGRAEGREEEMINSIRLMYSFDIPIERISSSYNLSIAEVNKILGL